MGTSETKKESGKITRKRWAGGYIRDGIFIIEKRIHGHKWHISTHCTSHRAALKHFERFEADPSKYTPQGSSNTDALILNEAMIEEFFAWHSAGVSRHWALNVRSLLVDWANDLKGADLRSLSLLDDLKPHLRKFPTQRHHRVKSIRVLFAWLRTEKGLITRAQDTTLDLPIPIVKPAQDTGTRKAVPWEYVSAVAQRLPVHIRDVLELLAATGWHVNEIRRFASDGSIRDRNASDANHVVAMLGTRHKNGRRHFTALVHSRHLDVARRIHERGHVVGNGELRKQMLKACAAAGVPNFQLGSMRHSVATWLAQAGVPPDQVSIYLGHMSGATTRRHYIDAQTAAFVLPRNALRVVA